MSRRRRKRPGLTSTVTFPIGNLAPEGSVIKSTAIDPSVVDEDGVYRHTGRAKVFVTERDAIRAIKTGGIAGRRHSCADRPRAVGHRDGRDVPADVGAEAFALRQASVAAHRRPLLRRIDRRLHRSHRARKRWPADRSARLRDGDWIDIRIDPQSAGRQHRHGRLTASSRMIAGSRREPCWPRRGAASRSGGGPALPDDTRLWAALQAASGGTWKGCVYDTDRIIRTLKAGMQALAEDGV